MTKMGNTNEPRFAEKAVTLNLAEWVYVVTALNAVSPSGGGSNTYTLSRRISKQTGVTGHVGTEVMFRQGVIKEWLDEKADEEASK